MFWLNTGICQQMDSDGLNFGALFFMSKSWFLCVVIHSFHCRYFHTQTWGHFILKIWQHFPFRYVDESLSLFPSVCSAGRDPLFCYVFSTLAYDWWRLQDRGLHFAYPTWCHLSTGSRPVSSRVESDLRFPTVLRRFAHAIELRQNFVRCAYTSHGQIGQHSVP